MNKHRYLANAVLWASAIVASAAMGATPLFSTLFLPALAAVAMLVSLPTRATPC